MNSSLEGAVHSNDAQFHSYESSTEDTTFSSRKQLLTITDKTNLMRMKILKAVKNVKTPMMLRVKRKSHLKRN